MEPDSNKPKKKYTYEYTRNCIHCSKQFISKRYATKTCSTECVNAILGRQKTYTPEQKNQALSLRKEGKTIPEIASLTEVKQSTLEKWFRDSKVFLTEEQYKTNTEGARWKNHSPSTPDGKKICSKCKQLKGLDEFYSTAYSASGCSSKCKVCGSQDYTQNAERYKEKAKRWNKDNPDQRLENRRRYYENNPETVHAWNLRWKSKNKDKTLGYAREYKKRNRPKMNHLSAIYRANKVQATPPWLTANQEEEIRQIYINCPKSYHVDHIIPLNGREVCGLHVPWNLQYLPASLNSAKSNCLESNLSEAGVCHQYLRRQSTIQEDIDAGFPINLKVNDFTFNQESISDEHREFIKRYEWLGAVGFGVRWVFTARWNNHLGAVIMISEPNGYSSFGMELECLIQRGACAAWTPKNLGSKAVMWACKWTVNNTPKRLFTAYSDPEAGEIGTIYQACNFDYLGAFYGAKVVHQLPNGKWVNGRYFTRTSAVKKWAKELDIEWQPNWCKPNGFQDVKAIPKDILKTLRDYGNAIKNSLPSRKAASKGKYVLLLGKNRGEQRELDKRKNWETLPYPKRRDNGNLL